MSKGAYKPTLGLRLGADPTDPTTNIASFTFTVDLDETSNSVRVLGQGEGTDREFGWSSALLYDGPWLESVISAPADSPIEALDDLANKEFARVAGITYGSTSPVRPVHLVETTVVSESHADELETGDTIDVLMDWGYTQLDEVMRSMTIDGPKPNTDAIDLLLNTVPPT